MRLAVVTPYYHVPLRGNAVTVQRIESGLRDLGVTVEVFSLDAQEPAAIVQGVRALRPDLVHGFNAWRTGHLVVEAAHALGVPAVVTFTGTDVNEDLGSPERAPLVQDVVRRCDALVAFHASIAARVAVACRDATDRLHVIGQAVHCRETRFEIGDRLGIPGQAFVVFQPAGIRRVKNIPSVIPPLSAVQRRHPELRYLLAGPVIEDEEGRRVDEAMRGLTWARYLGALPHEAICAILPQVHVVINSSRSEGGMPNAVLEAMSKAVPVLASDIEGNRSVIQDGRDGLLYRSPTEFVEHLERLIADPGLRAALGRRAQEKASRDFRLEAEIGGYLRLYRSLTAARV